MSILLGADLNGVSDHRIGRDLDGKEEAADLGIRGSLVRLEADGTWVAGPQAALAPHGRGDAWGAIGKKTNRIFLSDLYEELTRTELDEVRSDAVAIALPGILMDCELAYFAIPDTPGSDDVFRERFLKLLRRVRRVRRPMLIWRSIAAYLGWVRSAPTIHHGGQRVGVLSLMLDGLHFSQLGTEAHGQGQDRRLVPVRHRFGQIVSGPFQGRTYVDELLSRLASKSGLSNQDLMAVQTPWRIATGHRAEPEIVKRASDNRWITLPEISAAATVPTANDMPPELARDLGEIDILLIEGPFAGQSPWLNGIKEAVGQHVRKSSQIVELGRGSVAQGCLEAGDRLKKGRPVYFDFLPQLQINAMVEGKPQFVDLIQPKTRCAGGRPYKASAKDRYAIGVGAEQLRFWLFKEDFERGRKIEKSIGLTPDKQYPLSISVEQSPGQGLARVQISSLEYDELRRNPIVLDWMQMEEVKQSRAEILAELEENVGLSYPDASITKGHPFLWVPDHPRGDLIDLLRRFADAPLIKGRKVVPSTWETLHSLRQRIGRAEAAYMMPRLRKVVKEKGAFRPLNGDGSFPQEASGLIVPPDASAALNEALTKLESDVDHLLGSLGTEVERKLMDDIVGFGSWCFHRCPDNLIDVMLATYEGTSAYRIHFILLRGGVGRVVSQPEDLRRYFKAVTQRLQSRKALTMPEYSALGSVLGGVEFAATIMETDTARLFMQDAIRELIEANKEGIDQAYKVRFKGVLKLIAALLRHREVEWNFAESQSYIGRHLLEALLKSEERIGKFAARHEEIASSYSGAVHAGRMSKARRLRENAEVVRMIAPFVEMRGQHRGMIDVIESMRDHDDDDNEETGDNS